MPIPEGWKPQRDVKGSEKAPLSEYSAILHNQQKRINREDFDLPPRIDKGSIRLVTDAKTGDMQMYETYGFLGGGDKLIGTWSPSNEDGWSPSEENKSIFDSYFGSDNSKGKEQLKQITQSGKARTLEIATELSTSKDPELVKAGVTSADVEALKEKPGLVSVKNTEVKDPVSNKELEEQRKAAEQATQDTENGEASNTDSTEDDNPKIGLPKSLEGVEQRDKYKTNMRYPTTLLDEFQDYLKIQMVEYKPRGLGAQGGSFALASRRNNAAAGSREILSTIFLPIPGGIADNNTANWSKGDMGMLSSILADTALSAMGTGETFKSSVDSTGAAAANNTQGLKTAAGSKIVENLANVDPLKRNLGAVLNTNAELLFDGPTLRQFTFTYKFAPRSDGEAKEIRNIIRTLKQGMSAKKANEFLFIKSPHTFFLSYQHKNEDHPYLNKFKECALTGLAVQYAPDGNYATYYSGSMAAYQVTMSFSELEPVFDSDYEGGGKNGETSIGF
jgi:hypothetical protein